MAVSTPNEREFAVFRRGEVREDILRFFRNGLRNLPDPQTGEPFTEDVIRKVTTAGSRFYVEADAIDLACQGIQKRDEFLAQQMRVDRAGTSFLDNFHGPQWGETKLPATGGSGRVTATGLPGTTWLGSTTVPDPFATFGTDPAGKRYQVLVNGTANSAGVATLTVIGIDGGLETNIDVGTEIRWSNAPGTSEPIATVVGAKFSGGGPAETDAAFSSRLAARIRHKPGAGNDAQMRALARKASNAVEDAFVYPAAMNAGSCLVAVTQKRGESTGPNARVASAGVLLLVTAAIVPPGSPDIPGQGFVVVLPDTPSPTDVVVQMALRKGSGAGWADLQPFPPIKADDSGVAVSLVTNQTDFRITTGVAGQLPNGASATSGVGLMVWDVESVRRAVSERRDRPRRRGVPRAAAVAELTHDHGRRLDQPGDAAARRARRGDRGLFRQPRARRGRRPVDERARRARVPAARAERGIPGTRRAVADLVHRRVARHRRERCDARE